MFTLIINYTSKINYPVSPAQSCRDLVSLDPFTSIPVMLWELKRHDIKENTNRIIVLFIV